MDRGTKIRNEYDSFIGSKINRFTILKIHYGNPSMCDVICECGVEKTLKFTNVKTGLIKSCGCLQKEKARQAKGKSTYKNTYIDKEDYYIGLTRNQDIFYFDKEDYEKVKLYSWHCDRDGYIVARNIGIDKNRKECNVKMHRLILDVYDSKIFVDHKDRKVYNNTRKNLREVGYRINAQNSRVSTVSKTGYKGILIKNGKYRVYIKENKKQVSLGTYNNISWAIKVRLCAEMIVFGWIPNNVLDMDIPNCLKQIKTLEDLKRWVYYNEDDIGLCKNRIPKPVKDDIYRFYLKCNDKKEVLNNFRVSKCTLASIIKENES